MGCKFDAPFIQISFLRLTYKGLVEVDVFKIIPATEKNNMEDTCQWKISKIQ
jgi:hypothetical protein